MGIAPESLTTGNKVSQIEALDLSIEEQSILRLYPVSAAIFHEAISTDPSAIKKITSKIQIETASSGNDSSLEFVSENADQNALA